MSEYGSWLVGNKEGEVSGPSVANPVFKSHFGCHTLTTFAPSTLKIFLTQ